MVLMLMLFIEADPLGEFLVWTPFWNVFPDCKSTDGAHIDLVRFRFGFCLVFFFLFSFFWLVVWSCTLERCGGWQAMRAPPLLSWYWRGYSDTQNQPSAHLWILSPRIQPQATSLWAGSSLTFGAPWFSVLTNVSLLTRFSLLCINIPDVCCYCCCCAAAAAAATAALVFTSMILSQFSWDLNSLRRGGLWRLTPYIYGHY